MCPVRSSLKNGSLMSQEVKGVRTAMRYPLSGFQAEKGIGLYCLVPEEGPPLELRRQWDRPCQEPSVSSPLAEVAEFLAMPQKTSRLWEST